MNDHKSESQPGAAQSAEFLYDKPLEPVQAVPVEGGISLGPAPVPPILVDYRNAIRSHHSEKMPAEGVDLIRSGFALASLVLAIVAFVGCWFSMWALLPAVLTLLTGAPGLGSRRRSLAFIGIVLGLTAMGVLFPPIFP